MREFCTSGSVGAAGGQPPAATRAKDSRLYVALGDVDRAFAAFQQACDGESFATDLKIAPDYDAIRSDPRYHALLRCLKLE